MRSLIALLSVAFAAICSFAPLVGNSQTTTVRNIVLVHGAWADGSSWNKIIPILEKRGFHVTAVHLPFTTLADDAAAVKRAIALQDGPVLLVGHSYGGAVITEAGEDEKVVGLVYVAAFAPDAGESAGDLTGKNPPPSENKEFRPDPNGYLQLTAKGIANDFAPDLSQSEQQLLAATQGQVSGPNELGAKVTTASWRRKPNFYIVADRDRMISPKLETELAQRMNAKTIHLSSSHVPMLSHPTEVADFISKAAKPS